MAAAWYVLHVYSGYENKIERKIRLLIEDKTLDSDIVRDIKVPTELVTDVKDGKKRTVTRKFLPGYILLELDLPVDWKPTYSELKKIEGITGFVGTPANKRPMPLSSAEARSLLQKAGELKGEKPVRAKQSFAPGERVKMTSGPFESFTGTIEEVNTEKNKLKVMVGIFGRNVPVEVEILQVEKI